MGRPRPLFVQGVREQHPDKKVAVWFQDEASVGQQGTLTRVWAERGSRPRAVKQTEYKWGYVFGAVDPLSGRSSALISPTVNTALMSQHPRMIAEEAGPDTHVVLVLDNAGRHHANGLVVPAPGSVDDAAAVAAVLPGAPELMPMERVWQWMRQHDLSNRVFKDEPAIDRACRQSWNNLTPERLKTITATDWITHEN